MLVIPAQNDDHTGETPVPLSIGASHPAVRWANAAALLLAALSLVNIANWPLHDPDEFNYITAAREMVETGDWVTPHFNGAPRLVKPVLFYCVVAGAYEIFGVHVAVARLCSAAAAAGGVLFVWLMARRLVDRPTALLAAVIASTNVCVVQLSRVAITDATLWTFVALANYAFVRLQFPGSSYRAGSRKLSWFSHLFFVGLGLALLTKGPIALAWCLLPLLWPLVRRDWTTLRRFRWASGCLIVLAIVAPWTTLFVTRNAAALKAVLLDPHSSQSYAHFSRPVTNPIQFLAVVPQLAVNFAIWIPAIIATIGATIVQLIRARHWHVAGRTAANAPPRAANSEWLPEWQLFLIVWVTLLIVIYACFYKKSIRYMFPIVGPGSILLAVAIRHLLADTARRRSAALLVGICGVIELLFIPPLIAIIVSTHGLPVRMLWPHVAIQGAAGLLLLLGRDSIAVRRFFPATLAGGLSLQMALLPGTLSALAGPGTETLAPLVQKSLGPGDALLCYQISPRVLVFQTRRMQMDIQSFADFLAHLNRAPACLARESQWSRVPRAQRDLFRPIGRCIVQRSPPVLSADLMKNREPAILFLRRQDR